MNTLRDRVGKTSAGNAILTTLVLLVNAFVHGSLFLLLKSSVVPQGLDALIAILWGVAGMYGVYWSLNWVTEGYSPIWKNRVLPWVFVGPAVLILLWLLVMPTVRTFFLSFLDAQSESFVGFDNYLAVFSNQLLYSALRNNLMWVLFGTTACVVFGLLIAVLADRSSYEKTAKTIIFMPMAISMVAAGVIWKFIYYYQPGNEQIGLLNAIRVSFGLEGMAWTVENQPWNNLFLILILVWMQTGFALVIFSAALKGVPDDILEAARIDGAGEINIFFRVIVPSIKSTIISVTTTILVFSLKIFDIVMVMTGGQYDTEVVATQYYRQFFMYQNYGYGATLAILLLIIIIPVIWFNLRQMRQQGREGH